jgi:hypothetical protein
MESARSKGNGASSGSLSGPARHSRVRRARFESALDIREGCWGRDGPWCVLVDSGLACHPVELALSRIAARGMALRVIVGRIATIWSHGGAVGISRLHGATCGPPVGQIEASREERIYAPPIPGASG